MRNRFCDIVVFCSVCHLPYDLFTRSKNFLSFRFCVAVARCCFSFSFCSIFIDSKAECDNRCTYDLTSRLIHMFDSCFYLMRRFLLPSLLFTIDFKPLFAIWFNSSMRQCATFYSFELFEREKEREEKWSVVKKYYLFIWMISVAAKCKRRTRMVWL